MNEYESHLHKLPGDLTAEESHSEILNRTLTDRITTASHLLGLQFEDNDVLGLVKIVGSIVGSIKKSGMTEELHNKIFVSLNDIPVPNPTDELGAIALFSPLGDPTIVPFRLAVVRVFANYRFTAEHRGVNYVQIGGILKKRGFSTDQSPILSPGSLSVNSRVLIDKTIVPKDPLHHVPHEYRKRRASHQWNQ